MNGDIIASTHKDTIKAQANIYKIDSFSLISEDIIHQRKARTNINTMVTLTYLILDIYLILNGKF